MLSRAKTIVSKVSLSLSQAISVLSSFRCLERFTDANVQTAVLSTEFGILISTHRLDEFITLYSGQGLYSLCLSLKHNQG